VVILPAGLTARVRGLQTHKAKIERALPGSRVAVNLAGVEVGQLRRGMVVAHAGTLRPTTLLDVRLRHLTDPDAGLPLKHNAEVKFFIGAAEVVGKVRLLEHEALPPGEAGWAQIALAAPVVVVKGDRFILRRPSPGTTIGGGVVIEPHASRKRRRHDPAVISKLETLAQGTPGEVLLQALDALGPTPLKDALEKAGLDRGAAAEALAEVRAAGQLVQFDDEGLLASRAAWGRLESHFRSLLAAYHAAHPLRVGMPREELKSRLQVSSARQFNALISFAARAGLVATAGSVVRLPAHQVKFSPSQQSSVEALLSDFRRDPYNTPSVKDCAARVGDEVLSALVERGTLAPVSPDVLLLAETYETMVARIRAYLKTSGKVTVAEVRDMFSTSRKYALALMEYLDSQGITKRVGDERVLKT